MECKVHTVTFDTKTKALKEFNKLLGMMPGRKVAMTSNLPMEDVLIRKATMRYIFDSYTIKVVQRVII